MVTKKNSLQQKKKQFLFSLFIFVSIQLLAQTPEQVRWMNEQPLPKLTTSALASFQHELEARKERILDYTQKKGIPIISKDKDGNNQAIYDIVNGKPMYTTVDNSRASAFTQINKLHENQLLGLDLSGKGLKVYIWDGGHARTTHQEFQNEANQTKITIGEGISEYSIDSHATHVTGSIAATGVRAEVRGGAYQLDEVIAYDFFDAEQEAFNLIGDGILVSNHSYGFSGSQLQHLGLSNFFGAYVNRSRNWDLITYQDPYHLHIVSAGNDGTSSFNDNPLDPSKPEYDKLSGAKTSKNTLVVANGTRLTRTPKGAFLNGSITASSSQGPTDDLRIKPDITGIGFFILSTESATDEAYGPKTGTSMAAPNVASAALLLQELYEREIGNFARSATIKGLLLHTADDAGMEGPDAIFGWGFLNAEEAAKAILNNEGTSIVQERSLTNGDTYTIEVHSNGVDPLVASISWTDYWNDVNADLNSSIPDLVNDLDIKITQGSDVYFPWKLTGVDTNTKGVNDVDNFEKIEILNPKGSYTIEVSHKGTITNTSQAYTLIVTGISEHPVACEAPLNLGTTNLSNSSIELHWENSLDASNGYMYALMEPGKHPDQHAPILEGSLAFEVNSLTLSDLSPITNYDFFVRSNCGSSESIWNSIEFTTPCGTVTSFPFKENFNENSGDCWLVTTATMDSFWGLQFGLSHNSTTSMPISGGRLAAFISENLGDSVGFISPYFENLDEIELALSFYFLQPNNSGNHNTTRILKQELSATPVEIYSLSDVAKDWEEIQIPLGDSSTPFRIIIETTDDGGVFTAIDQFEIRFDGYRFNENVWYPRNPQLISSLDDNWWIQNKEAFLFEESKAKTIEIAENSVLNITHNLEIQGHIQGDGLLRFMHREHQLGQLDEVLPSSQVNVTTEIERWSPAGDQNRRAFRMISSSVTSSTSIFDNWQEGGATPEGFGTHITGSALGNFGFDASTTGNPSLFTFNHLQPNQVGGTAWEALDNTNTNTIDAGKAYRIFVRGDRNINLLNPNDPPNNTILRSRGELHTGNFEANLAQGNAQFSFVGNPYPSIVDMNLLTYTGDVNAHYYYIWDPSLNTQGGFVTIELPSGNNLMSTAANQFLMPGQGFFIRNNLVVQSSPSITFTEASKAVEQNSTAVFSIDEEDFIHLRLQKNNQIIDAVSLRFSEQYPSSVSELDAGKMGNVNENLALVKENALFSISKQVLPVGDEIQLFLNQTTTGNYSFEVDFQTSARLYIKDDYLDDLLTHVQPNDVYAFEIDDQIPASKHPLRFSLVIEDETLGNEAFEVRSLGIYPNPVDEIFYLQWNDFQSGVLKLYSMDGKLLVEVSLNEKNINQGIDVSHLTSGVYIVEMNDLLGVHRTKMVKR